MNSGSPAESGVPSSSSGASPSPGIDPGAPAGHADRDEDLTGSLAALSRLGSSRLSLEDLLTRVAGFAVQAIPGADGAGLTLLERDRSDTIVKSAPFVAEVDDIQYGLGEGPCISAASTGEVMRSGSLGGDRRWPRFGPRVSRLGVHSVLSLPLLTPDGVAGAMNVYAHAKDAFDDRAERSGPAVRGAGGDRGPERADPGPDPAVGIQVAGRVGQSCRHRPGDRNPDGPQRYHCGPGIRPASHPVPERTHQVVGGRRPRSWPTPSAGYSGRNSPDEAPESESWRSSTAGRNPAADRRCDHRRHRMQALTHGCQPFAVGLSHRHYG